MSKRYYLVLSLLLVLLTACAKEAPVSNTADANAVTPAPPLTIFIKDFSYSQPELKIKKGDTVSWANTDVVQHTVTSDSGTELDSGLLANVGAYSHTFNEPGIFEYHCAPHPNMKGKVIVE